MALSEAYQQYLNSIGSGDGFPYGLAAAGLTTAAEYTPEKRRTKALSQLETYGKLADYVPEGTFDQGLMDISQELGLPRTKKEVTGTQRVIEGTPTYLDPTKLSPEDRTLYEQAGVKIPTQQRGLISSITPEVRARYAQAGIQLPKEGEEYAKYLGNLAATNPAQFRQLAQAPGGLAAMPAINVPLVQASPIVEKEITKDVPYLTVRAKGDTKNQIQRMRVAVTGLQREEKTATETLNRLMSSVAPDAATEKLRLQAISDLEDYIAQLGTDASSLALSQDASGYTPPTRPRIGALSNLRSKKDIYMEALQHKIEQDTKMAPALLGLKGRALDIAQSRNLRGWEMLNLQAGRAASTDAWRVFASDNAVQNALAQADAHADAEAERVLKSDPNFSDMARLVASGDPAASADLAALMDRRREQVRQSVLARDVYQIRRQFRPVSAGSSVPRGRGGSVSAGPGGLTINFQPRLSRD